MCLTRLVLKGGQCRSRIPDQAKSEQPDEHGERHRLVKQMVARGTIPGAPRPCDQGCRAGPNQRKQQSCPPSNICRNPDRGGRLFADLARQKRVELTDSQNEQLLTQHGQSQPEQLLAQPRRIGSHGRIVRHKHSREFSGRCLSECRAGSRRSGDSRMMKVRCRPVRHFDPQTRNSQYAHRICASIDAYLNKRNRTGRG